MTLHEDNPQVSPCSGWTFRGSAYCQLICQQNKVKCLQWAQEHLNEGVAATECEEAAATRRESFFIVLFSDESFWNCPSISSKQAGGGVYVCVGEWGWCVTGFSQVYLLCVSVTHFGNQWTSSKFNSNTQQYTELDLHVQSLTLVQHSRKFSSLAIC